MSKDYLQIDFGGKQQGLKFNMNCLGFIDEVLGEEYESVINSLRPKAVFKLSAAIVFGGLKANSINKKEEFNTSIEEVNECIGEWSMSKCTDVINAFNVWATTPDELKQPEGEGSKSKRFRKVQGS